MLDTQKIYIISSSGKTVLLNPRNKKWAKLSEGAYRNYIKDEDSRKKFYAFLDKKIQLFSGETIGENRIQSIYYSITGRCNLNCEFCSMNSSPQIDMSEDLSLQEIEEILIPKLIDCNPKKIVISGGEPLMRKDCNEILKLFSKHFSKERLLLQTNGLLLNVKDIAILAQLIYAIEISIENIFSDSKLKKQMEEIFSEMHRQGIQLSLSFVVDSDSVQYLEQGIDLCHKYDAHCTMRIVSLVGRGKDCMEEVINEPKEILGIYHRAIVHIIEKKYFNDKLIDNFLVSLQANESCGAFGKVLAINPNGVIYMCPNFKDGRYSLGNILKDSFDEIKRNLEMKKSDESIKKIFMVNQMETCKDCQVKYFCTGFCVAEVIEAEENGLNVDKKCLAKIVLLQFAMFHYDKSQTRIQNFKALALYMEKVLKNEISKGGSLFE